MRPHVFKAVFAGYRLATGPELRGDYFKYLDYVLVPCLFLFLFFNPMTFFFAIYCLTVLFIIFEWAANIPIL